MTIKEIARMANVSIGTVDRVVNGRGGVSPQTKAKIEQIIEKTGFHANVYARNLKLGKKVVIGVMIPLVDSEYGYWNLVLSGIKKAEAEFSGYGVRLCYGFFDRDKPGDFTRAFDDLKKEGCTAYLIAPLCSDEFPSSELKAMACPVAFIDSTIPTFTPVFTIAQNPFKGGTVAARVTSLLCPRSGVFVVIQIHPDASNSFERARGFRNYIQKDSGKKVVDVSVKSIEEIPHVLDGLFSQYDDIRGIFTVNCIINSVGRYLVYTRRKEDVVAVGYDLVEENREALKNGSVDAVISQRPAFQGYSAISSMFRYVVQGESVTPDEVPIDIYLEENLVEGSQ